MIDYGKPASNQMMLELPGMSQKGFEQMQKARKWVAMHFNEWSYYKTEARKASEHGYASPNFILQQTRHKFKVSVPNALAPYFARIAMEEDPNIRFKTARSEADGWTSAKL